MIDCKKTKQYFAEKQRMTKLQAGEVCRISCAECPLSSMNNGTGLVCSDFETCYPDRAIFLVQLWSNTNQQKKTYLSEFLRNYPKVKLNDAGVPDNICPYMLGLSDTRDCKRSCVECWNHFID